MVKLSFTSRWSKPTTPGLSDRMKDAIKPVGPLKPRLEQAVRHIQSQVSKLESTEVKLKERDTSIFGRVVNAIQKHNIDYASIYANELAEIRKMYKMVTQAKLAMQQIVLRLNTVQDLGDVVVTLAPAMSVVRSIRSGLVTVLPQAETEIGEISTLLSGILVDAGQIGGGTLNFEAANEDAQRIIGEAQAVAEQRMEAFPEVPSTEAAGTAQSQQAEL